MVLKNRKGFTLLELLTAMMLAGIMLAAISMMYISTNKQFFINSDKNEILYEKQRIVNVIKKDITYGTVVEVLGGGKELQLTESDEVTIKYKFDNLSGKLNRGKVAKGTLTFVDAPADGDTITIDGVIYEFDTATGGGNGINTPGGVEVQLLTNTATDAATELVAAIGVSSVINARVGTGATVIITAKNAGIIGNDIVTVENCTNAIFNASTLVGGGEEAKGLLKITGTPTDGDTITIGTRTYEFDTVALNDGVLPGNIEIQLTTDNTVSAVNDLITAISLDGSSVVNCTAGIGTSIVIVAKSSGPAGNTISTTETCANAVFDASNLSGGIDTEDIIANLKDVTFAFSGTDEKYIKLDGTLKGKANNIKIDFDYIFEIQDSGKWDYEY